MQAQQQRGLQQTGPQARAPQQHGLQQTGPQQRPANWRDPRQRGEQGRAAQQRGPLQGDAQRGYGQGDAQRTAPGLRGPRQGDPQVSAGRRVAPGPAPQRPVPGWRDPNQRAMQAEPMRQRDPRWGEADWDDPQWGGPGGGPYGDGPGSPYGDGPDWSGPGGPGGDGPGGPYGDGPGGPYGDGPGSPYGDGPGGPYGDGPGWDGPGRRGRMQHGPRRRGGRKRTPLRHRRWAQVTAAVLVALLITVSWSLGHALTAPGGGTLSDRIAEWARDHYLGPLVTFGEWLTYQPPKVGGKPSFSLSGEGIAAAREREKKLRGRQAAIAALYAAPQPLKPLAGKALPGEGQWRVLTTVGGRPAIFGTYLRASSVYSSYVAGIAEMNQHLVKFQLRPGSEDPGGSNWNAQPWIPPGTRTGLLATFNSGFKIAQSDGGFYLNGHSVGTLTNGVASEVYYRDGQMTIGVWGQTVHMTPDVVAVRQNLHLIVIHGHIPNSVNNNVESSWGATLGGSYYVWRSGVGLTKNGRVVFAYGPALNVREIAQLLQRAGAVTAMQLDINPEWMSFMYYLPKHHPKDPTPFNLLPDTSQPANRYYSINGRDFTAVYAR